MDTKSFISRIKNKECVIGVVGLGYVGLPLVLTFGKHKLKCLGLDIDQTKVDTLHAGGSYIRHLPGERTKALIDEGLFAATTDFSRIKECDALLLCVPTPLNVNREPDMSYIESTARALGPHLQKEQLVILESTTYPGTTDELLRDILEETSGLSAEKDFYLAYSPEREDPGNPNFDTQRIPKVVGALTPEALEVSVALYEAALDEVVPVSSTRVAEMSKLLENIFRSVNIALVNEMKLVAQSMDVDIWEVIRAASTKPFGFMPFYPGPGLGGHCIPIDPFYLTWKAREYEVATRFIELAGEVNTAMPRFVIDRTMEALNSHKKALNGAAVLVIGLAYKKDVDDMRESPSLKLIKLLKEKGAVVSYHDPFIPKLRESRHYDLVMDSVELSAKNLQDSDVVLIATDHSDLDYELVGQKSTLIVDTRNAMDKISTDAEKVWKA